MQNLSEQNEFVNRKALRLALKKRNMSLSELAKELGCWHTNLSQKMNGYNNFTEEQMVTLARLFGISIFNFK